ncbi:MAG: rhodanese-like domain-containing protein [Bacteroidales bacterium]|nr:rhodanese-like domain-containing protein [Bacteroidales bacterium]
MNPRILLALFIIPLGMIIAAVPQNTTHQYKLSAAQLLEEATSASQFITTDQIAEMLIQKDPKLQLIDVRTPDEFIKFSLPGAINVPLSDLLSDEYRDILDQDIKMNVFYSNGTLHANEAWMITTQLGYKNNYVMQGGTNYWAETILNPQAPATTSPDEEIAKYDFRKGASMALGGGGALESTAGSSDIKVPDKPIIKKATKKRVQGGC